MKHVWGIAAPVALLLAIAGILAIAVIYRMQNEAPAEALAEGTTEQSVEGVGDKAGVPFASYYTDHPDDGEVVGQIGDTLIYRGEIRRIIAYRLGWESVESSLAPSATEQDALHQVIVPEIDILIWNEAAQQAGFTATVAEVDEYIADIRAVCARKEQECEYIAWHGMSIDEYFEYQRNNTEQFLARRAYLQSRIDEFSDQRITWDTIRPELRKEYQVLWFDQNIQAVYEAALADPAVNFEN